ncbi:MAG TPA: hypothetical protein VEP90_09380 [Methylomirabilota bacterium]|nr:hypothetical protein [Methylomirabilota bacterium]
MKEMINLSGEYIVLVGAAKYGTLSEKHVALNDRPVAGLKIGVLEKIEGYTIDAGHINKRELAKRTPFFSKDQREHIIEETKAAWALRKPYNVDGYRVDSYVREGNKNVSLQYSFRSLKTGRFEKPKEKKNAQ